MQNTFHTVAKIIQLVRNSRKMPKDITKYFNFTEFLVRSNNNLKL